MRAENGIGKTEVIGDFNQRVSKPRKVGGSGVQRGRWRGWGVVTSSGDLVVL